MPTEEELCTARKNAAGESGQWIDGKCTVTEADDVNKCGPNASYPGWTLRENFKIDKGEAQKQEPETELDKVKLECCKKTEFFHETCRQLHRDVAAELKKKGCPAVITPHKRKKQAGCTKSSCGQITSGGVKCVGNQCFRT